MENYEGDLSDVVRAAADGGGTSRWQFPRNTVNYNYYSSDQDLGHPFSYIRDPLVPNIDTAPLSELLYAGGGMNSVVDDEIKRPANIFSRMLQISPTAKQQQPLSPCEAQAQAQRGLKPSSILVSNNNYSGSLISPTTPGLQISSPRNTAIKRRKSQAKKVVCIPAPAPANSRATGEIVPSDLWAWRKYGQKPIKGSPYPRGYYRCSSSKGCLARKQVERSRTDPNMLVITYTSEHNHPWPTQRNALAGSTRSQSSKNSNNAAKDSSPTEKLKHMETSSTLEENSGAVKEETDKELENQFEAESNEGFKPTLADSSSNHDQDSFFEDLGEIGDEPMNLFEQGFPRDDLDPFTFYDWATNGSVIAATSKESNRHS